MINHIWWKDGFQNLQAASTALWAPATMDSSVAYSTDRRGWGAKVRVLITLYSVAAFVFKCMKSCKDLADE